MSGQCKYTCCPGIQSAHPARARSALHLLISKRSKRPTLSSNDSHADRVVAEDFDRARRSTCNFFGCLQKMIVGDAQATPDPIKKIKCKSEMNACWCGSVSPQQRVRADSARDSPSPDPSLFLGSMNNQARNDDEPDKNVLNQERLISGISNRP
jgi:hypothetical protein